MDAANGAAAVSARNIFLDLNAEIAVIGDQPDGLNINAGVGSTHPEQLQALVKETGSAIGLAFDGDSDRLIAVDENGDIVDGVVGGLFSQGHQIDAQVVCKDLEELAKIKTLRLLSYASTLAVAPLMHQSKSGIRLWN